MAYLFSDFSDILGKTTKRCGRLLYILLYALHQTIQSETEHCCCVGLLRMMSNLTYSSIC